LRSDPDKYLKEMDGEIFDKAPDLSIMEDNQIIDVVVEKAIKEIQELCDSQNLTTTLERTVSGVKKLAEQIGHVDRRFMP
jgi:hypothetical protein